MPAFLRVWSAFPGYDVLGEIESINILEVTPPDVAAGAGTGTVLLVGEFERGRVNTPTEVFGGPDLLTKFGGLGWVVGDNKHAGAVACQSGGDEPWNGNGFIWARNKKFRRFVICRVNNSAGQVTFRRYASLLGGAGPFAAEDGDTIEFTRNGTTTVTATFEGTPGQVEGDGFPGDASQVWSVDANPGPDAFTDRTAAFNDSTSANLTPFPGTEATGDYFAIGRAHAPFDRLIFDYAGGTAGAGGTVAWEYWNGSAWTALAGVTDATAGFTTAAADGLEVSWTMPANWARSTLNGVPAYYVRARVTGVYATNPILDQGYVQGDNVTGFVGGEWLELRTRRGAPTRVIEFTAADQTREQVIARINATLALDTASIVGTQLVLSSEVEGGAGYIEVVDGTARAILGFPTAAVQQVHTWTVNATTAGNYVLSVTLNVGGVETDYPGTVPATGAEANDELAELLAAEMASLAIPGITWSTDGADLIAEADANVSFTVNAITEPNAGDVTDEVTQAAVLTVGLGLGNVQDLSDFSVAEAAVVIDALTGIGSDTNPDGLLRAANNGTASTGTLQVTGGTLYAELGFDLTSVASAADGDEVTIPAGTRVQDSSETGTIWVTLEDIETGTGGGPWLASVRPFYDDDTALASTTGNVTTVLDTLSDSFQVTNAATITRLSAVALDVRYREALDSTLGLNTVAKDANIVCSARSSATIMQALKENALTATASGLAARKYVTRPLIGTTIETARSNTGQGVGNTLHSRNDRGVYCFPACKTLIPEIAETGLLGGTGFTEDGVIEVGADSFYASLRSQFNPEENVGQALDGTPPGPMPILALEDAYDPYQGGTDLDINHYIAFKRAGICALRIDPTTGACFQSDVTCVDPTTNLVLADANRRYMHDMISDTFGALAKKYSKKMGTVDRITGISIEATNFLKELKGEENPKTQRIEEYSFVNGTTEATKARGIYVWTVQVKMLGTIKSMLFNIEVGATVKIAAAA